MMNESVTIKKIHIEKIFDMYNYDIDFNYDNNISYLIAPNGFGKTTILKMIDFIYRPFLHKSLDLLATPFSRIDCELTDGKHVGITKRKVEETDRIRERKWSYSISPIRSAVDRVFNADERLILNYNGNEIDSTNLLEECLNELSIPNRKRYTANDSSSNAALPNDHEELTYRLNFKINRKVKKIQKEFGCNNDVTFIKSDRISSSHVPVMGNYTVENIFKAYDDALIGMERRIHAYLNDISRRYSQNLNMAKDQFLSNIIESEENAMSFSDFTKALDKYNDTCKRFTDIGFLNSDRNRTINTQGISEEKYRRKAKELSLYIKSFSSTFDNLENSYKYLKLLIDVFNKRNEDTGKTLTYKDGRAKIILKNKKILPFSSLSSGEKNDLMMFYHLIFDTLDDSIVLIDEPEISLNIKWQEEFGKYLQEICELNNLHAIVATHSPHIVNGHVEAITEIMGNEISYQENEENYEPEEAFDYDLDT